MENGGFEETQRVVDEVDVARMQEYSLLATLLLRSPNDEMLGLVSRLPGDNSPLGLAHRELASAAGRTSAEAVTREYFALFVGVGRGELLPYASYYLTGSLHGRPLAELRMTFQNLGIERTPGEAEPEDHAASLLQIMAGLAGGLIPAPPSREREVFEQHLVPWMGRFFSDLSQSPAATFYASVGKLGKTFIDIETQGFQLPP